MYLFLVTYNLCQFTCQKISKGAYCFTWYYNSQSNHVFVVLFTKGVILEITKFHITGFSRVDIFCGKPYVLFFLLYFTKKNFIVIKQYLLIINFFY